MSTVREIEDAIRSLAPSERNKLLQDIPDLFPELGGDAEWERIIADERPRPALTELLDKAEAELRRNPDAFPELSERDLLIDHPAGVKRSIATPASPKSGGCRTKAGAPSNAVPRDNETIPQACSVTVVAPAA